MADENERLSELTVARAREAALRDALGRPSDQGEVREAMGAPNEPPKRPVGGGSRALRR